MERDLGGRRQQTSFGRMIEKETFGGGRKKMLGIPQGTMFFKALPPFVHSNNLSLEYIAVYHSYFTHNLYISFIRI